MNRITLGLNSALNHPNPENPKPKRIITEDMMIMLDNPSIGLGIVQSKLTLS